jgi:hypothetical protein
MLAAVLANVHAGEIKSKDPHLEYDVIQKIQE